MSNFTDNLEAKFSSISVREQKLVFYAVPLVICLVFIIGLIEPAVTRIFETRSEVKVQKLRLVNASNSVDLVQAELNVDPDVEINNQIAGVTQQITSLERQFAEELEQLVPPYAMPLVLEQLFANAKKLKLMSMASIPPTNIFKDDADSVNSEKPISNVIGPELFKHGLRIRFEGSFFDTRDFLMSAEQMGWKLHWQEIEFAVSEYPRAQVDIELFTLSRSEAYINVN
jgi:MSHA biogenesis protein MshJ